MNHHNHHTTNGCMFCDGCCAARAGVAVALHRNLDPATVAGFRSRSPSWIRRLGRAAGPGGLMRAAHKGNEAVAPPCCGAQRQRGRCPSSFGGLPASAALCARRTRAARPLPLQFWRAAGPGGLMCAAHKGNEAAAPPCCGAQGQRGRCPSTPMSLVAGFRTSMPLDNCVRQKYYGR